MFAPDDTIVAVATPAGRGGIGVVRISGTHAPAIGSRLLSRRRPLVPREATFARLAPVSGAVSPALLRDEVVITWFPAPASYTGEHVIEISGHGSPIVSAGDCRSRRRLWRAPCAAGRIHAPQLSERQARSRTGGGGR